MAFDNREQNEDAEITTKTFLAFFKGAWAEWDPDGMLAGHSHFSFGVLLILHVLLTVFWCA